MIHSKKGVSPLIATVLLIAFAVALGAVVMNWGKTRLQDTVGDIEVCSNVELAWFMREGKPQVCYDDYSITMTVQNGASKQIDGLKIIIDGSKDIYQGEEIISSPLGMAEAKKISVSYDLARFGDPRVVKLIPKISEETGKVLCSLANSIVVEKLARC